jgi:hypothetical protein
MLLMPVSHLRRSPVLQLIVALTFVFACTPAMLAAAEPTPDLESSARGRFEYEFRAVRVALAKLDAFHARLRDHQMSALERHGVETQAVFVPAGENPDRLVYVLTTAETAQAMDAGWAGLAADPAWQEVVAETDSDGPLVVAEDGERLVTTAWSPPFIAERAGTPRIFERRTYACPDPAKHAALLQRFHNHTMALFAKHGMQNVVYWVPTTPAASEHRLVYLLGHESEAAAKKSFSAFRKDAGWLAAKKESEERAGGSLTNADKGVVSEFLEATDYSPLR